MWQALVIFFGEVISCFVLTKNWAISMTDLVTVFDAILTIRQTCEKLQCSYENLMASNFRETAVPKKISVVD